MFKAAVKELLERNGWFLRRSRGLSWGIDFKLDLGRIGEIPIKVIFDIGAHKGESVELFARHFPMSWIYSFEPVTENYLVLKERTERYRTVRCFNMAVGEHPGTVVIKLQRDSQTHSLRHVANSQDRADGESQEVLITTVDQVMKREEIERISILKVDTEGFERQVLSGAQAALAEGRVDYIFLEASLDPTDTSHSSLIEIQVALRDVGYSLVGIYDQVVWPAPVRLAYFNVLFARESLIR